MAIFDVLQNTITNTFSSDPIERQDLKKHVTQSIKDSKGHDIIWDAGRFIGQNEVLKRFHMGNEFGSQSSNTVFTPGFEDPTRLMFKIEFGEWGASLLDTETIKTQQVTSKFSNVYYEDYDQFPMGLLNLNFGDFDGKTSWSDQQVYNTYNYLMNRNEDARASYIKQFVQGLYVIQKDMPYIFQKISGLDKLQELNLGKGKRIKDAKITIDCIEGIDLKIRTLLQLYRKAAYDDVWQRWILPDIYRYFKMIIYVFDRRILHTGLGTYSIEQDDFPIYAFECSPCEIDIESTFENELSSVYADHKESETKINITVHNVKTYYSNKLFNKVESNNYVVNWISDFDSITERGSYTSTDSSTYSNFRQRWLRRMFMMPSEHRAYYNNMTHKVGDDYDFNKLYGAWDVYGPILPDNSWHRAVVQDESIYDIRSWSGLVKYLKKSLKTRTTIIRDSRYADRDYMVNDLARMYEYTYIYEPRFMYTGPNVRHAENMMRHRIEQMIQHMLNSTYIKDSKYFYNLVDPSILDSSLPDMKPNVSTLSPEEIKEQTYIKPILDTNLPEQQYIKPILDTSLPEQTFVEPIFNTSIPQQTFIEPEFNLDKPEHDYIEPILNLDKPEQKLVYPEFNLDKTEHPMVVPIIDLHKQEQILIEPIMDLDKIHTQFVETIIDLHKNDMEYVYPEIDLHKNNVQFVKPEFNLDKPGQTMVEPIEDLHKNNVQLVEPEFNLDKPSQTMVEAVFNTNDVSMTYVELNEPQEHVHQTMVKADINTEHTQQTLVVPDMTAEHVQQTMIRANVDANVPQQTMVTYDVNTETSTQNMLNTASYQDTHKPSMNMIHGQFEEHTQTQNMLAATTDTHKPTMNYVSPVNNTDKEYHNLIHVTVDGEPQLHNQMVQPEYNEFKSATLLTPLEGDDTKFTTKMTPLDMTTPTNFIDMVHLNQEQPKVEMDMTKLSQDTSLPEMDMTYINQNTSLPEMNMTYVLQDTSLPDMVMQTPNMDVSLPEMTMQKPDLNTSLPDMDMTYLSQDSSLPDMIMQKPIQDTSINDMVMVTPIMNVSINDMVMTEPIIETTNVNMTMTEVINNSTNVNMSMTKPNNPGDIAKIPMVHPYLNTDKNHIPMISPNINDASSIKSAMVSPNLNTEQPDMEMTRPLTEDTSVSTMDMITAILDNNETPKMKMVELTESPELIQKIQALTKIDVNELKSTNIQDLLSLADIIEKTYEEIKERSKHMVLQDNKPNIPPHVHMKMQSIKQPERNQYLLNKINAVDQAALDRAWQAKQNANVEHSNGTKGNAI